MKKKNIFFHKKKIFMYTTTTFGKKKYFGLLSSCYFIIVWHFTLIDRLCVAFYDNITIWSVRWRIMDHNLQQQTSSGAVHEKKNKYLSLLYSFIFVLILCADWSNEKKNISTFQFCDHFAIDNLYIYVCVCVKLVIFNDFLYI